MLPGRQFFERLLWLGNARKGLHINIPISANIGYKDRKRRDSRGRIAVQNRESDENTPI
jgi:hypothetical protein